MPTEPPNRSPPARRVDVPRAGCSQRRWQDRQWPRAVRPDHRRSWPSSVYDAEPTAGSMKTTPSSPSSSSGAGPISYLAQGRRRRRHPHPTRRNNVQPDQHRRERPRSPHRERHLPERKRPGRARSADRPGGLNQQRPQLMRGQIERAAEAGHHLASVSGSDVMLPDSNLLCRTTVDRTLAWE